METARLEALLERLQTTKSIDELQVWAHELRDYFGVTHVVYHTVTHKGEQVGEWRSYDERLTAFLLRCYRPERYGRARELPVPRYDEYGENLGPEDPGITLDGGLSGIEFDARDVPPDPEDGDEPHAL